MTSRLVGFRRRHPRLEPLWVSVHHQHQASMPELAPYVSDETTWRDAERSTRSSSHSPTRSCSSLRGDTARRLRPRPHDRRHRHLDRRHVVTGDTIAELRSIAVAPDIAAPASARTPRRGRRRTRTPRHPRCDHRRPARQRRRPPPLRTPRLPPHLALPQPVPRPLRSEPGARLRFQAPQVRVQPCPGREEEDMRDLTDAEKNTGLHAFVFIDRVEPEGDLRR